MENVLKAISEYLSKYGLKVLGAIVILVVGRWLAGVVARVVEKALLKAKVEKTIAKFIKHLTHIVALVFVVIAALAAAGVETTQFAVVIGAAGLAVGLALQGSLANFASGFLMIIFRPFKVGDFIEAAGTKGFVKEIGIFNTFINTPDNIRVIIPNAKLTGDNIMNYTANGTRRVDLVIGVSYEDDIKKAKQVIEQVLASSVPGLMQPTTGMSILTPPHRSSSVSKKTI